MQPHRPQRTCLGCGARDDQKGLLRFVVEPNGELRLDRMGKGRGGYVHRTERCWEAFLRRKRVYRAFHLEIEPKAKERLVLTLRERHWES